MAEIDLAKGTNSQGISLLGRAFVTAVPLTMASGVFLGVTGYPIEEWPFVGGVVAASLLLSGILVLWSLVFLGKKLADYGRLVLAERGVDVDAAGAAVPRAFWVTASLVFLFLLLATVWGLGLSVLVIVLERMGMLPLGGSLSLVAAVMFLVGVCGFVLLFSVQLLLYYSVRRMERVSAVARIVFALVGVGNSSVLLRRVAGLSVRSGTG